MLESIHSFVIGLKAGWTLESENILDAGGHKRIWISKILRLLGQNFSVARIF